MRERSGYICAEIFPHFVQLRKKFKHMKTLNLLIMLLSPLLTLSQTQFVAFQPQHSSLEITQASETIRLSFEIEKPFYIQADEAQIEDDALIPTHVSFEPIEGIRICQMTFEKPQNTKAFANDLTIHVLDDTFTVEIEVEAGLSLASGIVPLQGALVYQASDALRCFPPKKLEFTAELEVIMP